MEAPPRYRRALKHLGRSPELFTCARVFANWRDVISGYLGVGACPLPIEGRLRSNHTIRLETAHDVATAWMIFCRHEYDVFPTDEVVLDVGANIGAFSLFAAERAPRSRIIALEPFPETAARLDETVRRNNLGSRVSTKTLALAANAETRRMDDAAGPSQSRGMFEAGDARGIEVKATSLGKLLEVENIETVDLLKIDIEGGEHEVIAATPKDVLRRIRRIALEYHPNGSKKGLFAKIEAAGFRVHRDREDVPNSGVAELRRV